MRAHGICIVVGLSGMLLAGCGDDTEELLARARGSGIPVICGRQPRSH